MNYARLDSSPRLQRVLAALQAGPKTLRQIIEEANVCAVNSAVAEINAQIRDKGMNIRCELLRGGDSRIYKYTLEIW